MIGDFQAWLGYCYRTDDVEPPAEKTRAMVDLYLSLTDAQRAEVWKRFGARQGPREHATGISSPTYPRRYSITRRELLQIAVDCGFLKARQLDAIR